MNDKTISYGPPGVWTELNMFCFSGYWYMHCHMEAHQLEGMTLIIKEGLHSAQKRPPTNFPTCGDYTWSYEEYEEIVNGPMIAGLGAVQHVDGKVFILNINNVWQENVWI